MDIEDFYADATWYYPIIISIVVGILMVFILFTLIRPSMRIVLLLIVVLVQSGFAMHTMIKLQQRYGSVINWSRKPLVKPWYNKAATGLNRSQMWIQPGVPIYLWGKYYKFW